MTKITDSNPCPDCGKKLEVAYSTTETGIETYSSMCSCGFYYKGMIE